MYYIKWESSLLFFFLTFTPCITPPRVSYTWLTQLSEHGRTNHNTSTYHIGCWYVGGSLGPDTGVQLYDRIILSANKKFLNKLATNRSCRNNFWNNSAKVKVVYKLILCYLGIFITNRINRIVLNPIFKFHNACYDFLFVFSNNSTTKHSAVMWWQHGTCTVILKYHTLCYVILKSFMRMVDSEFNRKSSLYNNYLIVCIEVSYPGQILY